MIARTTTGTHNPRICTQIATNRLRDWCNFPHMQYMFYMRRLFFGLVYVIFFQVWFFLGVSTCPSGNSHTHPLYCGPQQFGTEAWPLPETLLQTDTSLLQLARHSSGTSSLSGKIMLLLYELHYKKKRHKTYRLMGESFQDYSWIQDFEADFPQQVSLRILN